MINVFVNPQPAQAETITIPAGQIVWSNLKHTGKDIVVKGKYIIGGPDIANGPLKLNSLTVAGGGVVTHQEGGNNGTVLAAGNARIEWSGVWKPIKTIGGFKEFTETGLCFLQSSMIEDIEIEAAPGKTWQNFPVEVVTWKNTYWPNTTPRDYSSTFKCYYDGLAENTDKETYTIKFSRSMFLNDELDPSIFFNEIALAGANFTKIKKEIIPTFTNNPVKFFPNSTDASNGSNLHYLTANYKPVPKIDGIEFSQLEDFGTLYTASDDRGKCPTTYGCEPFNGPAGAKTYGFKLNGTVNKPGWVVTPSVNLDIAGTLKLEAGGSIDVTGLGYPGSKATAEGKQPEGYGPGGGTTGTDSDSCDDNMYGGGGSHGGLGRAASVYGDSVIKWDAGGPAAKAPYGSLEQPATLGSGGAGSFDEDSSFGLFGNDCDTENGTGGTGGGSVHIKAKKIEIVKKTGRFGDEGKIYANGTDGVGNGKQSAGGAGGSIWLESEEFVNGNSGTVNINPGDSSSNTYGQMGTAYYKNNITGEETKCINSTKCTGTNRFLFGDNIRAYGGVGGGGGGRIAIYTSVATQVSTHTITASHGPNGMVSPDGVTTVADGGEQIYTITPDSGYKIENVVVDGVTNTESKISGSYTFSGVTADHTISATFIGNDVVTHTITASHGDFGMVTPDGVTTVAHNGTQAYTITPDVGYKIENVLIDGVPDSAAKTSGSYSFENVTSDHTISATFAKDLSATFLKLFDNYPSSFEYLADKSDPGFAVTGSNMLELNTLDVNADTQSVIVTFKIGGDACSVGSSTNATNYAKVEWDTGSANTEIPISTSPQIQIMCPIDIKGDIGSTIGGVNNKKITVSGPAVAVSGSGDVSSEITGDVVKLNNYNNGNTFSGFVTKQQENIASTVSVLLGEATPWEKLVSTNLQNSGDIPLVWKKSGGVSLESGYSESGTLIIENGDVNLGDGFKGSDKPMGIIAQAGNVNIRKSSAVKDEDITNVGIYAPNGTVTIDLTNYESRFSFTGTIVAKKVEIIHGTSDIGGSITWSSLFAKNPPPGFTDIISLSTIGERAPE